MSQAAEQAQHQGRIAACNAGTLANARAENVTAPQLYVSEIAEFLTGLRI